MQPKLPLTLTTTGDAGQPTRFTSVCTLGVYILKPPTAHYPSLPEVKELAMHPATLAGLATAPSRLVAPGGSSA
jgi:serine/threonine-protein kinase HipA